MNLADSTGLDRQAEVHTTGGHAGEGTEPKCVQSLIEEKTQSIVNCNGPGLGL